VSFNWLLFVCAAPACKAESAPCSVAWGTPHATRGLQPHDKRVNKWKRGRMVVLGRGVATTSGGRGRRVGNETQPPETAQRRYVVMQDIDLRSSC